MLDTHLSVEAQQGPHGMRYTAKIRKISNSEHSKYRTPEATPPATPAKPEGLCLLALFWQSHYMGIYRGPCDRGTPLIWTSNPACRPVRGGMWRSR